MWSTSKVIQRAQPSGWILKLRLGGKALSLNLPKRRCWSYWGYTEHLSWSWLFKMAQDNFCICDFYKYKYTHKVYLFRKCELFYTFHCFLLYCFSFISFHMLLLCTTFPYMCGFVLDTVLFVFQATYISIPYCFSYYNFVMYFSFNNSNSWFLF